MFVVPSTACSTVIPYAAAEGPPRCHNPSFNAMDRLGRRRRRAMIDAPPRRAATTMKFHLKTYGCQMNVNDTDIVRSILVNHHLADPVVAAPSPTSSLRFVETYDEIDADVLLTNTCAIRENAEQKVWHRQRELRSHDRNFPLSYSDPSSPSSSMT